MAAGMWEAELVLFKAGADGDLLTDSASVQSMTTLHKIVRFSISSPFHLAAYQRGPLWSSGARWMAYNELTVLGHCGSEASIDNSPWNY